MTENVKPGLWRKGLTFHLLQVATDKAVMNGHIAIHRRLTGETITPRQVLKEHGFTEEEIRAYLERTGTTE